MRPLRRCFRREGITCACRDFSGGSFVYCGLLIVLASNAKIFEEGYQGERTLGMSLALSASKSPGLSVDVVAWPGRGTEGIVRWVADSEGTVVPSTAMSVIEPPWG